MKSDYEYFLIDNVICIRDLNLGGASITNNAEGVIAEIIEQEPELKTWSTVYVVYEDSMGIWDEIILDEKLRPVWFACIGAHTPFIAIHRLKLKYAGL